MYEDSQGLRIIEVGGCYHNKMLTVRLRSGMTLGMPTEPFADLPYFQGVAGCDGNTLEFTQFSDEVVLYVLSTHAFGPKHVAPPRSVGSAALFADYIGSATAAAALPGSSISTGVLAGDGFIVELVRGNVQRIKQARSDLRYSFSGSAPVLTRHIQWLSDLVDLHVGTVEWVMTQLTQPAIDSSAHGNITDYTTLGIHAVYVYLAWIVTGSDILRGLLSSVLAAIGSVPSAIASFPRISEVRGDLPVSYIKAWNYDAVLKAWVDMRR